MKFEVLTTFPDMFDSVVSTSILGRAQEKGLVEFKAHDLRNYTHDKHRTTDDAPYGGGQGLLMKPEPIFEAVDDLIGSEKATIVAFSPVGQVYNQDLACVLAESERIFCICGHYEGMDERVYTLCDYTLCMGDYVLTGGELPALILLDSVARLIPGVLGNESSAADESFSSGLLEYPQYTRPASFRGLDVPQILMSGDHAKIDAWRRQKQIERTALFRSDLLEGAELTDKERLYAEKILSGELNPESGLPLY
jgi:tRNA (guanine37-N1)-methyltransferase